MRVVPWRCSAADAGDHGWIYFTGGSADGGTSGAGMCRLYSGVPRFTGAGADILLHALQKEAFLTCEMRLGEGSGAVAIFPLLDFASDIYHKMSTFAQIEVEAYQPLD